MKLTKNQIKAVIKALGLEAAAKTKGILDANNSLAEEYHDKVNLQLQESGVIVVDKSNVDLSTMDTRDLYLEFIDKVFNEHPYINKKIVTNGSYYYVHQFSKSGMNGFIKALKRHKSLDMLVIATKSYYLSNTNPVKITRFFHDEIYESQIKDLKTAIKEGKTKEYMEELTRSEYYDNSVWL